MAISSNASRLSNLLRAHSLFKATRSASRTHSLIPRSTPTSSPSIHSSHSAMSTLAGTTIPTIQTAAVVEKIGANIDIRNNVPVKKAAELAPGECLVRITHTGVCHTDLHAKQGDWPVPPKNPLIGGHEGVGEIVAIGENTANSPVKLGDRVGIKWLANSCLDCEFCRKGNEMSELPPTICF